MKSFSMIGGMENLLSFKDDLLLRELLLHTFLIAMLVETGPQLLMDFVNGSDYIVYMRFLFAYVNH